MQFDMSLLWGIVTSILRVEALVVEFLRGLIPNKGIGIKSYTQFCLGFIFFSFLFHLLLRRIALTKEHFLFLHLVHYSKLEGCQGHIVRNMENTAKHEDVSKRVSD